MEEEEGEQDPSFPLASSSADKAALATGVLNDTAYTPLSSGTAWSFFMAFVIARPVWARLG